MEIVFSDKCLKFKQEGHPESPERVRLAYEHLKDYYKIVKPSACFDKELLNAHTKRLVDSVKNKSFYDADCPLYDNIFDYASLSAGAAIMAAKKQGFSLMRPPGHHAGKDSLGGFCYFNNIAVAVKSLGKKTLILDIDAHHGNGTQDVFLGDENVTYVSLHKSPEYPGTGLRSEQNCINFPLQANCGEKVYLKALGKALSQAGKKFELIAVSAGFDTYEKDPLASLGLKTESYKKIGKIIKELNIPRFAILEGGYCAEDLGKNIHSFLEGAF